MTPDYHPKFWLTSKPIPGRQNDSDIVTVPASTTARHTIIVAKSGSGKSFFLGRLIEELLLGTKSRCLILDSNADFRRAEEVEDEELWTKAKYDIRKSAGRLPTELTRERFASRWADVGVRVVSANYFSEEESIEPFRLWWPSLSEELIGENLSEVQLSQIHYCHVFVSNIAYFTQRMSAATHRHVDFIKESEKLLMDRTLRSPGAFATRLWKDFGDVLVQDRERALSKRKLSNSRRHGFERSYEGMIDRRIQRAVRASNYVQDDMINFYFARALDYQTHGILGHERPNTDISTKSRLRILDLPSLDKRLRFVAVNATLGSVWEEAHEQWSEALGLPEENDERVPTFIVVDEAHNLMPANTTSRLHLTLREQFRTIAAEGRKYGLFLILATQRPDKLDPLIISECDNKAVMRLDSGTVVEAVRSSLGLEGIGLLEKCLSFKTGRVLLTGDWSPEPQVLYAAARRTVEGGRNLRAKFWAVPYSKRKKHKTTPRHPK